MYNTKVYFDVATVIKKGFICNKMISRYSNWQIIEKFQWENFWQNIISTKIVQ